jgi:hypothetical protein
MNTAKFVQQLRSIAEDLKPLTLSVSSGAATWDGTKYVKTDTRAADPVALVWQSLLTNIAELVEAQGSPLTPRQRDYLKSLLFGAMGSLNDISFSQAAINRSLDEKRSLLFATFSE